MRVKITAIHQRGYASVTFPVYFDVLGHRVLAHTVLEIIAYAAGAQLYWQLRRRRRAVLGAEENLWIIVGCIVGAAVGSKLLAWIESPLDYWPHRSNPATWMGGKTIVGGLLGGWAGVELVKRRLRITRRTGDLFVYPLILGMAIGRIGCFLTGLPDHTYGLPTRLPWGVDFGDGIRRHPTQLYDIAFLILLAIALRTWPRRRTEGELFRQFIAGYLAWRFAVEFIKPRFTGYGGFSAIQWASLASVALCVWQIVRMKRGDGERGSPRTSAYERAVTAARVGDP
jgi:prolipoprotein diacylglyceryltransferase